MDSEENLKINDDNLTDSSRNEFMGIIHWEEPFQVTPKDGILNYRAKEKSWKKKAQDQMVDYPIHKKMTQAAKLHMYPTSVRQLKEIGYAAQEALHIVTKVELPGYIEPEFMVRATKDVQRVDSKSITDYIAKNRKILLLEHAVQIKHEEMSRMHELAQEEEEKMSSAEQRLEKDALAFNEFIKESDKLSSQALQEAVHETKIKLEKMEVIKNMNAHNFALKSDIAKLERVLWEYKLCSLFLEALIPQNLDDEKSTSTVIFSEQSSDADKDEMSPEPVQTKIRSNDKLIAFKNMPPDSVLSSIEEEDDLQDKIQKHFKDPNQVLEVLKELEEQNLSLIQQCHDKQEALEEAHENFLNVQIKMNQETELLHEQMTALGEDTKKLEEKAKRMERMVRAAKETRNKADQEKTLQEIGDKVAKTYKACMEGSTANMDTVMMLTGIENRLVSLLNEIDSMPPQKLDRMYRVKQLERKNIERKLEAEARKLYFEQRMQKAIERTLLSTKNKVRRKLMYRSQPADKEAEEREALQRAKQQEEDEFLYFFS